jgi:hypothetical protein
MMRLTDGTTDPSLLEALQLAALSRLHTASKRSKFGTRGFGLDDELHVDLGRLQLQGELQSKKEAVRLYKGVFHGVGVILKNEGPRGLLRGLGCAVRAECAESPAM